MATKGKRQHKCNYWGGRKKKQWSLLLGKKVNRAFQEWESPWFCQLNSENPTVVMLPENMDIRDVESWKINNAFCRDSKQHILTFLSSPPSFFSKLYVFLYLEFMIEIGFSVMFLISFIIKISY